MIGSNSNQIHSYKIRRPTILTLPQKKCCKLECIRIDKYKITFVQCSNRPPKQHQWQGMVEQYLTLNWNQTLTFFDSVNMNSSTSFVITSSGKVFSFVERNLMALSLTISSPWRIWLNKPPKVPEWRINWTTQIILEVMTWTIYTEGRSLLF